MKINNFYDLQARLQSDYQSGNYLGALELANGHLNEFPDQAPLLNYWRICMAARTGQKDLVLDLLDELIKDGFWYSEILLRKSPSLQPLQGDAAFEQRLAANLQLQDKDQNQHFPLLVLRNEHLHGVNDSSYPLLIGLHANASSAQASLNFWQAAAQAGWLVALPQSSQAMWKDAYVWEDRPFAEKEIQKHFQVLREHYPINDNHIILGGISHGGELAIELALKGAIPVQAFIAIGPAGPILDDIETWPILYGDTPDQDLRGYVIYGAEDQTIHPEKIELLVETLNEKGIPTGLENLPNASHDFSQPYADSLLRGLSFIENPE